MNLSFDCIWISLVFYNNCWKKVDYTNKPLILSLAHSGNMEKDMTLPAIKVMLYYHHIMKQVLTLSHSVYMFGLWIVFIFWISQLEHMQSRQKLCLYINHSTSSSFRQEIGWDDLNKLILKKNSVDFLLLLSWHGFS